MDPAILYPLLLTLHAQASPAMAAAASALPRADPAEVVAVAFLVGGFSGPLPPLPLSEASPLDPVVAATSVAPVGGSDREDLPAATPLSPRLDPPVLLIVYVVCIVFLM